MNTKHHTPVLRNALSALLLTLTLLFASCGVQELYEVPTMPGTDIPILHPTRITVNLEGYTDGMQIRLLRPYNHALLANFEPATPVDVEAGSYHLLAVNSPGTDATLTGTQLTMHETASRSGDGETASRSGSTIGSAPNLYAAFLPLTLSPDRDDTYTVRPEAYTRPLVVRLTVQGTTADAIASCRISLTGIRPAAELSLPFGPDSGSGTATFSATFGAFTPAANGNPEAELTVHLLGIDPAAGQRLSIAITLKDGIVRSVEQDVSTLLSGFYSTTEQTPATLHAIISLGIDEVTGSITGWTPGWDDDITGE